MPSTDPTGPLQAATNVRLTPAQHAALELIAKRRGVGISTAARELLDEQLRQYVDEAGVNLLEAIEADMAAQSITSRRMAHFFGDRDAAAASQDG